MMDPADLDHCREAIRHGSLSFHAASRLLPRRESLERREELTDILGRRQEHACQLGKDRT